MLLTSLHGAIGHGGVVLAHATYGVAVVHDAVNVIDGVGNRVPAMGQ